jgi:hypothetical protein
MEIRRLRIFSDLHLEFFDWTPPPAAADAIVLAGDAGASGTLGAWSYTRVDRLHGEWNTRRM